MWWNLIDGWPQMSDAVVDYYYTKKLAYSYIKRSSVGVLAFVGEKVQHGYPVMLSNCTSKDSKVKLKITDIESNKVVFEGESEVKSNSCCDLGKVPFNNSQQGMLLIEYEVDGESRINTYLYGTPRYELSKYREWLNLIQKAENKVSKH